MEKTRKLVFCALHIPLHFSCISSKIILDKFVLNFIVKVARFILH